MLTCPIPSHEMSEEHFDSRAYSTRRLAGQTALTSEGHSGLPRLLSGLERGSSFVFEYFQFSRVVNLNTQRTGIFMDSTK